MQQKEYSFSALTAGCIIMQFNKNFLEDYCETTD